jgi:hypothetical protein
VGQARFERRAALDQHHTVFGRVPTQAGAAAQSDAAELIETQQPRLHVKLLVAHTDPEIVDAFLATARDDAFWADLENERIWDQVLALELSTSPYRSVPTRFR